MKIRLTDVLGLLCITVALVSWLSGDGGVLPEPTPSPGARTVVVVGESKNRPTYVATIVLSQEIREYCEAKGHTFRSVDPDMLGDKTRPYAEASAADYSLVVGEADYGPVLEAVPLPKNVADTIQAIKAAGG